jgi:hypothetical protein
MMQDVTFSVISALFGVAVVGVLTDEGTLDPSPGGKCVPDPRFHTDAARPSRPIVDIR